MTARSFGRSVAFFCRISSSRSRTRNLPIVIATSEDKCSRSSYRSLSPIDPSKSNGPARVRSNRCPPARMGLRPVLGTGSRGPACRRQRAELLRRSPERNRLSHAYDDRQRRLMIDVPVRMHVAPDLAHAKKPRHGRGSL